MKKEFGEHEWKPRVHATSGKCVGLIARRNHGKDK